MKAKTKRKPPKLSQLDARFLADQIESVAIIMWGLAEQKTIKSWVSALRKECMK